MKHLNFLRGTALAFVAVFSIGAAQAATIDGSLNFGGQATGIPGPTIFDAIGLSFTSGFITTFSDGDFAASGIAPGSTGTLADFFFNPLSPSPVNPFLQILFNPGPGKFTFVLESIQIIDQTVGFLVLNGTGTMVGTGYDDTAYDFSMSVDGVPGGLFAFSGTIAPTVVPVPGALILLLSGLAAVGVRRRA